MRRMKTLLLSVFAVLLTSAFPVGCTSRSELADRGTGQTNQSGDARRSQKGDQMTDDAKSGYAPVNGLKMYYEIQGVGRPLVLLHGGVTTIDYSFGKMRPSLAKTWKTIAIEQQGHGHTADIDRSLTYEQMAEDTAALLRHLKIGTADVFGWSDGGVIALGLAARHPDLVRKVAIFGSGYNPDGETPEFKQGLQELRAEDEGMAELRDAYAKVAPEPKNWPLLIEKIKRLAREFKGWPPEEIKSIKAPVMVMIGDADIIRPEHAVELFRLLPHGQLAVLPLTDHFAPVQRSEWLVSMITTFLDAPMPKTR
jgi:pimeloyl-ACP methyl ester carboxylesterase